MMYLFGAWPCPLSLSALPSHFLCLPLSFLSAFLFLSPCSFSVVKIFDPNTGDLLRRFGKGLLGHPIDLTQTRLGYIAVADLEYRKIHIFAEDGTFIRAFANFSR